MKKILVVSIAVLSCIFSSCGGQSGDSAKPTDSSATTTKSPDSAANNAIVPPSAAPGNASNSSLADTTYKGKDSSKTKKQ
jgi:hypothetical protein